MSTRELRDSGSPLKILGENVTMVLDRMDFICSIANNLEDICEKISPQLLLVKFSLKECKVVIDNYISDGENPKLLKIKEEAKTLGDDYDDFLDHGVFGADMDTLYPEDDDGGRRTRKKYKVKKEKKGPYVPKKKSGVALAFIDFMKEKQNTDEVDYQVSEVASALATRDFSYFIITPEDNQETDKEEIVIPKSETTAENEKNIIKTERGDDQDKFTPSSNGQDTNMDTRDNNVDNHDMQSEGQVSQEGQRSQDMNFGQDQALNYADEQAVNYAMFRDNQGENMGNNDMMRDGQMESRDQMLRDGENQNTIETGEKEESATMIDAESGELKETKVKVYEPVLLCKLCEYSSPNKDSLLMHLENSHFSKSSECPHCHIKLMEFEVELHVKNKHSNNCKYCQEPIPSDELKAHQKACLHEKGVVCSVCGKIFGDRKKLRCHISTHTMEPRVECDICNKMYKSEKVLDHHKRVAHTGKTFKCEECDKEFDRQDYLKKHKMHVHMNNQSMACQDCGKVFPSELKLNRHMAVHTIPATIPCDICNRLYREQKDLNHHKKIIHSDNVETCYICGANYKIKSSLKAHIKSHLGIKDYTCDLCGKGFAHTQILKKHVEQFHSETNNFKCHLCEKDFKYKYSLQHHLKIHAGLVERCTCEECGKSFTMKNNLKKHMRKVHKIFQKKPILLLDIKNHQGMQGIPGVPK